MIGPSDNGGSTVNPKPRRRRRGGKIGATKFTRRKQNAYIKLLEKGNRRMASARAVGVDNKTVQRLAKTSPKRCSSRSALCSHAYRTASSNA